MLNYLFLGWSKIKWTCIDLVFVDEKVYINPPIEVAHITQSGRRKKRKEKKKEVK